MREKEIRELIAHEIKLSLEKRTPVGSIVAFAGNVNKIPNGWKLCNGKSEDKKEFPKLFDVIGTIWGGTGEPNFDLPDLQGYFLRGVDETNKVDPGGNIRYSQRDFDDKIGAVVGSFQLDAFATHTHTGNMKLGAEPTDGGAKSSRAAGGHGAVTPTWTSPGLVNKEGGNETRPKNAYVHWIIKVK